MKGVTGWFERRGEIPLSPPLGLREYGPLADDPERGEGDFSATAIRGAAFVLEYCDSRGWMSTRAVRCLGIDLEAPVSLRAFCNVRKTARTFRIDRIISVADFRTGAILSGSAHFSLLAPYLPQYEQDAAVRALRVLQEAVRDGVFALLQVGMPGGRLSDEVRDVAIEYIQAEALAAGCTLPPAEAVSLWVDNLAPPLDAVVEAVGRLLGEKDKFVRLLPWLLRVARSLRSDVQEDSVRELIAEVRAHYQRKLREWPSASRRLG
jgi:hypothetical protein